MGYTDKFRAQHDEILKGAGDISDLLKQNGDPVVLRRMLSTLAGKVNFHLAMEDEALYPRLIAKGTDAVQKRASKFKTEMGGLAQVFTDYNNKWTVSAIRQDVGSFATETRKVFGALAKRIERENAELYPLADQVS